MMVQILNVHIPTISMHVQLYNPSPSTFGNKITEIKLVCVISSSRKELLDAKEHGKSCIGIFLLKNIVFHIYLGIAESHILCKMSLPINSNFSHFLLLPGRSCGAAAASQRTQTHT